MDGLQLQAEHERSERILSDLSLHHYLSSIIITVTTLSLYFSEFMQTRPLRVLVVLFRGIRRQYYI